METTTINLMEDSRYSVIATCLDDLGLCLSSEHHERQDLGDTLSPAQIRSIHTRLYSATCEIHRLLGLKKPSTNWYFNLSTDLDHRITIEEVESDWVNRHRITLQRNIKEILTKDLQEGGTRSSTREPMRMEMMTTWEEIGKRIDGLNGPRRAPQRTVSTGNIVSTGGSDSEENSRCYC